MTQRQVQKAQTRRSILEAAAGQFAERGFAGTSFATIAAAMGKPKSAVGYNHFASKDDLADAVAADYVAMLDARVQAAAAQVPEGLEGMLACLGAGARMSVTDPLAHGALRLLVERAAGPDTMSAALALMDVLRRQVDATLRLGDIPATVSAADVTEHLVVSAIGVHSAHTQRMFAKPIDEALQTAWGIALRGFEVSEERLRAATATVQAAVGSPRTAPSPA